MVMSGCDDVITYCEDGQPALWRRFTSALPPDLADLRAAERVNGTAVVRSELAIRRASVESAAPVGVARCDCGVAAGS